MTACPCCTGLPRGHALSGSWPRDEWRRLCDHCLRHFAGLTACQHTLDREREQLLRQQGRLARRAA